MLVLGKVDQTPSWKRSQISSGCFTVALLPDELIERTSFILDEIASKTVHNENNGDR